jgi:hypothetical protein
VLVEKPHCGPASRARPRHSNAAAIAKRDAAGAAAERGNIKEFAEAGGAVHVGHPLDEHVPTVERTQRERRGRGAQPVRQAVSYLERDRPEPARGARTRGGRAMGEPQRDQPGAGRERDEGVRLRGRGRRARRGHLGSARALSSGTYPLAECCPQRDHARAVPPRSA